MNNKIVAQNIAKKLFTTRGGRKANRLVLELANGVYSDAGWAELVVVDLIERELNDAKKKSKTVTDAETP